MRDLPQNIKHEKPNTDAEEPLDTRTSGDRNLELPKWNHAEKHYGRGYSEWQKNRS